MLRCLPKRSVVYRFPNKRMKMRSDCVFIGLQSCMQDTLKIVRWPDIYTLLNYRYLRTHSPVLDLTSMKVFTWIMSMAMSQLFLESLSSSNNRRGRHARPARPRGSRRFGSGLHDECGLMISSSACSVSSHCIVPEKSQFLWKMGKEALGEDLEHV
jgi:hypothetical protein